MVASPTFTSFQSLYQLRCEQHSYETRIMFAKFKSKLKAALKEAKEKRNAKQNKHISLDAQPVVAQPVVATDKQSDALSRPRECLKAGMLIAHVGLHLVLSDPPLLPVTLSLLAVYEYGCCSCSAVPPFSCSCPTLADGLGGRRSLDNSMTLSGAHNSTGWCMATASQPLRVARFSQLTAKRPTPMLLPRGPLSEYALAPDFCRWFEQWAVSAHMHIYSTGQNCCLGTAERRS